MADDDFALTDGWGHYGVGGVIMPGQGRAVERPFTFKERTAMGGGLPTLGETTFDVYLNARAFWRNVPAAVWYYNLGGYQVLKKWLPYRQRDVLGRTLKPDEVHHFTDIARRIAEILSEDCLMKVVDWLLLLPQFLRRVVGREDFWWIFGVATILSIGAVLSWLFWGQLHGEDESGSTTIRNIALILAAPIALVLAIWRSIVAERQAETNQRGLLNERYQKGAEMLGSGVLSVRLGGIYALRRLAEEHPEYHIQIMGLFCAFVRHPTEDSGRKVEKVELSDSDLEPADAPHGCSGGNGGYQRSQ